MSRTTNIEWTQHTWNPFAGCSICSHGCKNCYAMAFAHRLELMGVASYSGLTKKVNGKVIWTGKINKSSDSSFYKPLSMKRPALFFVNSMSDFFHENVRVEWQIEAMQVIEKTPQHNYQILTKRPENIEKFISAYGKDLPSNVWLGVTVESNKTSSRIDILRSIKATTRFISFEPLIDSVGSVDLTDIHWAITGGESGSHARDCHHEWIDEIHNQCVAQDVPHFFKQYGKWDNNPLIETGKQISELKEIDAIGKGGSLLNGEYIKNYPLIYSQSQRCNIA